MGPMRRRGLVFVALLFAIAALVALRDRAHQSPFSLRLGTIRPSPIVAGRPVAFTVSLRNTSGTVASGIVQAEIDGKPASFGAPPSIRAFSVSGAPVTNLPDGASLDAEFSLGAPKPGRHVVTVHYYGPAAGKSVPTPHSPSNPADLRRELASLSQFIDVADVPAGPPPPPPTISFLTPPGGATACAATIPPPKTISVSNSLGQTHDEKVDLVSCYMPRPGTEVWSIARPNDHNAETDYPEIVFRPGDVVQFIAGGCAQPGGLSAFSARRYVNPNDASNAGRSEDGLHFGSASIPGVMVSTPFRDLLQAPPVTIGTTAETHLLLQYADDHFDDNGYDGLNWGDFEQCRDLKDSFVIVVIERGCGDPNQSAGLDCRLAKPMDLVPSATDENGFAVNPQWGIQWVTGAPDGAPVETCSLSQKECGMPEDDLATCTAQPTFKRTSGFCCGVGGATRGAIPGHVNFRPAVFNGSMLKWVNKWWADGDYNMWFRATNGEANGVKVEANDTLHGLVVEFDSDEFPDSSGDYPGAQSVFWREFKTAVDKNDTTTLASLIQGNDAVVLGMLGPDCGEGCHVEVHPVYVLAIRTQGILERDTWSFFARNWGNEGGCYSHDVPLNGPAPDYPEVTDFTIMLPPPIATPLIGTVIDVVDVHVGARHNLAGKTPSVEVLPTQDGPVRMVFHMLPTANQSIIEGTVVLSWRAPAPATGAGCNVSP